MSEHGRAHAHLSPSSAERWMNCPASIRLIESLDRDEADTPSVWAEEGTRAHTLAEIEATRLFITEEGYDFRYRAWKRQADEHDDDIEEMSGAVADYLTLLQDLLAGHTGHVVPQFEIRVQTGVPGCWGTADAALMSSRKISVVDFKYGQGVVVSAERNPQLMLYAVGVLELLDVLGTVEEVEVAICQPRAGGSSVFRLSADSLRQWRDHEVREAADETQRPDARFGPSETACRWCPAAGICRARLEWATRRDFGSPDALSTDELADAVRDLPGIRDWCNAVEAEALHQAYSEGVALPGLKVVLSGGKRSIADKGAAIEALVAAGFDRGDVSREDIETLGKLDRLVGKEILPEILGPLLKPGEGKPALVDESDPREPTSPGGGAKLDFQDT